jgi:hypothetical protein
MHNGTTEEQMLRQSLERILLDLKFMYEGDMIPYVFDDFIYQTAFELMTPEFMEEFNNVKDM